MKYPAVALAGEARAFSLVAEPLRDPHGLVTHVVSLSGYGQDSDVQAALEAGFDEHLTKPPDPGRLENLLRG